MFVKTIYYCAAVFLFLSACDKPAPPKQEISAGDLRSGHVQRMFLGVPEVLVEQSTRPKNPLNLEDPKGVARALDVTLTGDPSQVLYVMQMTAPSSNTGTVKREIPIRVDNIKHGAQMIRNWQSP